MKNSPSSNTHVNSNKAATNDIAEEMQRENLFTLLQQAIKAHGYTYKKLAQAMNISELSIKRLFKDKDCKMSRLLEICSIIGISIDELIQMQQRLTHTPEFLSEQTEIALAQDKQLFLLLILLISQLNITTIQTLLNITEAELYLKLRELEKLQLIALLNNKQYRFTAPLPIRWRMDGPLSKPIKTLNQQYIAHCLDHQAHPNYAFTTTSRLISKSSAQQIQAHLIKIREEFDYLTTQDQLFYKPEELHFYKLVFGMGPFPIEEIIKEQYISTNK